MLVNFTKVIVSLFLALIGIGAAIKIVEAVMGGILFHASLLSILFMGLFSLILPILPFIIIYYIWK